MDRVREEGKKERERERGTENRNRKEKPEKVFTDSYKWTDQELVRFQGLD